MLEMLSSIGILAAFVWSWRKLAAHLKADGFHWIGRHALGCLIGQATGLGVAAILLGLGFLPDENGQRAFDLATIVVGLILVAPIIWIVRRSSKSSPVEDQHPKPATDRQRSRIAQALLDAWSEVRNTYRAELEKQKARQADKERRAKVERELAGIRGLGNKGDKPSMPPPQALRSASQRTLEARYGLDSSLDVDDEPNDEPLLFEYQDASGNVSTRQVTAWDYDGTYITGHCATANAERTFRHDRIVDFISGEELLDASHGDGEPVIGFLGFDPEYTLELEQTAEEEDLILRRYLAADLTHLCVGPHLDAAAVQEAKALGLRVITEAQFDELLEERWTERLA